jgi:hypothetical protein
MTADRDLIYLHIESERLRQEDKWGEQHHANGTAAGEHPSSILRRDFETRATFERYRCEFFFAAGNGSWQTILEEEVSEAYAAPTEETLREELTHVIAVAVAWIEDLDSRSSRT